MNSGNPEGDRSELEARAKALFDASVAGLDARVRSRLTQARHAAAAAELRPQGNSWSRLLGLPAAGIAAAAVALIVVVAIDRSPEQRPPAVAALAAEDMAILANADNLEFLEEMEFYAWLEGASVQGVEVDRAPGIAPNRS